ncbi:hypothetical protein IJ750_06125 [bacterium]|nr:hypothetical protein [bacterium]
MAESQFNMNNFLNEYKGYNTQKFTVEELAKKNMEAQDVARAKEAVQAQEENSFLKLTMSGRVGEALRDAGIGERVMQQVANTAENIVTGWIDPIAEYLEKYENIFDQNVYNQTMQEFGKQHFFNNQALSQDIATREVGTKFFYTM